MWNISIHLWCTYREMLVIAQFTMVKFTQRFSQYISTQHSQGFKTFPEITIPSTIHTNLHKRKFLNEEKFVVWILSLYLLSNVPVSEIPMISSRRLLFILDRHQGEDVIICGWSLDISDNNTVSNMGDNTTHTDKEIEVINSQLHPVQHCFNFSGLIQIFFHSLPRKLLYIYLIPWNFTL